MSESPIVAARDLTRVFGEGDAEVRAVDGVTVDLPRGRFTAIMGPSGSGKSTLMHMLAGLDRPTSGSVQVDGVELGELDDEGEPDQRRKAMAGEHSADLDVRLPVCPRDQGRSRRPP